MTHHCAIVCAVAPTTVVDPAAPPIHNPVDLIHVVFPLKKK
jgi:hypothetical protein